MADKPTTNRGERNQVIGYKGSMAGKQFDTDEEMRAKKERQEFDTAMGWAGIGGAAKKPRGPEYEKQLVEWRKKKAQSAGQAKALAESK